ncbi:RhtX/FptX family siderophore transporter [Bordetella trematum]|uniref:RhtX/FptX family siderophore transporter n=1 Tax=Bordetella trematum TaxID=123899 RepID=UPI003C700E90
MMSQASRPLRFYVMIAALYVSQGMPLGLAMEALPTLLRRDGVALQALAWLPLVGLPWVVKFLWATQVDNRWSARLGRRRSWILPMQTVVLGCLLGVALTGIGQAGLAVALMALASLASATQDIATDGLTAEHCQGQMLTRANAIQVGGTMVGFFLGGPGCLALSAYLGERGAVLLLAAVVAFSLVMAGCWREPVVAANPRQRAALRHFFARRGAWPLVAMAGLSATTAVSAYGLSKLFLIDAGWAPDAVGRLGMAAGMVTIVLGCGLGAWLIGRLGARTTLALGLLSCAAAALSWLSLAGGRPLPLTAFGAQALGAFGAGAASVALMTLGMRFARAGNQAGTDMTAIQSARDLGEILASAGITGLAAQIGYGGGFGVGLGVALFTLAVLALAFKR